MSSKCKKHRNAFVNLNKFFFTKLPQIFPMGGKFRKHFCIFWHTSKCALKYKKLKHFETEEDCYAKVKHFLKPLKVYLYVISEKVNVLLKFCFDSKKSSPNNVDLHFY